MFVPATLVDLVYILVTPERGLTLRFAIQARQIWKTSCAAHLRVLVLSINNTERRRGTEEAFQM